MTEMVLDAYVEFVRIMFYWCRLIDFQATIPSKWHVRELNLKQQSLEQMRHPYIVYALQCGSAAFVLSIVGFFQTPISP